MKTKQALVTLFRGVSQIMLQKNAVTGLFFLLGLFWVSFNVGLGAVLGVCFGTIFALLLGYKKQDILDGLYGFNATLVGILMFTFYKVSITSVLVLILGVFISVLIMRFMHRLKLNPLTAPFVKAGWISMGIMFFFKIPMLPAPMSFLSSIDFTRAFLFGVSQVMLQANIITGILFYLGLFANGFIIGAYSLVGNALGMATAMVIGLPIAFTNLGIYGYNAVLCAIAFSGKRFSNVGFALIAVVFSVVITYLFGLTFVPALTAPFVLATWITLGLKRLIKAK